ncbi:hypothetical protein AV540_16635 [Brevibacillus parabrevis]|uniref:Rieske 2Fe-2S domain-containing protein n=1 Tax=Brevibacillus parabrevis TaxID=54914 RepID=UPI0007AC23B6|nr:Rieske 2Fe-2S domain-containing protein [Brevibacillus parabrevis]KZE48551.1 hypothetical protein AV540_16635 [Brevibacillus parabrevis]
MHFKRVEIGPKSSFEFFPTEISIENRSYFLTCTDDKYHLLSSTCPHAGGKVNIRENCLECPLHGWRFSKTSGESINVSNQKLTSFPVTIENDILYSVIPKNREFEHVKYKVLPPKDLTVALHSHACLEITHDNFSLLTDPWLEGPAFLGAWIQYPAPVIDACDLTPSAIFISHEHSDHFHEPTLQCFDRKTPIYYPDFPNKRITNQLKKLGFSNLIAMRFGETIHISNRMKITCFETASLWNDAIILIEIDDFRILNINDAGLNPRLATYIGPVDVIASSFSPGASGYPLTWTHISKAQKAEILENAKLGSLKMLQEAVSLYGGKYLIPFASHFQLWHPSHQEYFDQFKKNTLLDVVEFFDEKEISVIDILPGERWNVRNNTIARSNYNQSELYDPQVISQYLKKRYHEHYEIREHLPLTSLTTDEVKKYFLHLNTTSEISYCEDIQVGLKVTEGEQILFEFNFEITNGQLHILEGKNNFQNLLIEIPGIILQSIIRNNLSWDEAHIGYWCKFSRYPDVYHAGFWRLLQAPYFRKPIELPQKNEDIYINKDTIIADLLERFEADADQILRRYGLYCLGCQHSTFDSIFMGAKSHGVSETDMNRLIKELNKAFCTENTVM